MPTASLLVRASQPCAQGPTSQEAWRKDFESGSFSTAALNTWLQEVASAARVPPLWSRLTEAKESLQAENVFALILCAQTSSTETVPEALAVAARSLCASAQCAGGDVATAKVPYLSAVTFGSDFNSERLAALEELCAWSGGLSFNVAEPGMLRPAAEGLAAHLFTQGDASGFLERRRYYAQKQELGTCFMELPKMVKYNEGEATPSLTPLHLHRKTLAGLPALLLKASAQPIDFAVPSESMLTVLSDVTLVLAHRWSRSLRTWRIRRGMRDLVFGEPGSIGLDFEEPVLEGTDGALTSTWKLRATHPPASALKMENGSELVAINRIRVTERTPRSEVARRISSRPVSLTFRLPACAKVVDKIEIFPMVVSEIVVSELREGFAPLKTAQPPLSTALQRANAAKARGSLQNYQASRILSSLTDWGTMPGGAVPAWVEHLPADSPLGRRWTKAASMDLFAREPGLLFRMLMFCGEVQTLAMAGRSCCCWRQLLLDTARPSQRGTSQPPRRLWSWVLRFGRPPSASQRLGFWRWATSSLPEDAGNHHAAALLSRAAAARSSSDASSSSRPEPSPSPAEALLETAARVDALSLARLSSGLAGGAPSAEAAQATASGIAAAISSAQGTASKDERLPPDILERLLMEPWLCQRLWLLSDVALPWLALQCRHFQVAIAAHLPNLFRHLMGEGLAPELFFCRWLQGLFQTCLSQELQLRIWDHFIFERSFKVFIKLAVAIFASLEKRMLGQDIEKMMDLLFDAKVWQISDDDLFSAMLNIKVTRAMLKGAVS